MEIRIDPSTAGVQYFLVNPVADNLPPGYAEWVSVLPEDQRGLLATPFGDGIVNLIRFALGGAAAPEFQFPVVTADPQQEHTFSFIMRSGVTMELQLSEDLQTWAPIDQIFGADLLNEPLSSASVEVSFSAPATWANVYFRLLFEVAEH
ncbi:MAG: hypothetical protein LR015_08565 [Verrucomicrobia bacterium]|nr:hypothetical protein [Verrucomicrobiota bacterium]